MSERTFEHIFSKRSKESLCEFLKASKISEASNDHEHIEKEFKMWRRLIKNLGNIIELPDNKSQSLTIEENSCSKDLQVLPDPTNSMDNSEGNIVEDKYSAKYLVTVIQKEPVEVIQLLYRDALPHINSQTMIEMEDLMKGISPCDTLVKCYCKELLFKMMSESIEDILKKIFNDFYTQYSSLVIEEIIGFMKLHDKLDLFLVYLNSKSTSDKEFSSLLLRAFLDSCKGSLSRRDLFLLDYFISKNSECDLMKMVVGILYSSAMELRNDKDYGKLLFKIVDHLGPELISVKNQIDYILSVHASMWKTKIRKKSEKYLKEI
ncbi:uncharacterized protein LOC123307271 [Coccinella septempunctata]|uniref:uncharacterized protein LOC123307271 n=1 Tax=Coccinella septempunctata TaxID=41139 RepID=UPI001D097E7F|nr:uncharacterized protein LOC123307271 [Coccinella septempunctata]